MQNLKHIKHFSNYIVEQDMMGGDMEQEVSAPKDVNYSFIFIEEGETGTTIFPDGSSSGIYPTYSMAKSNIKEWADTNIKPNKDKPGLKAIEIKKQAVLDYIMGKKSGITPDNKEYLTTFKNQVKSDQVGTKLGDTEVIFYEDDTFGTDKIEVTFIIIPKK